MDNKLMQPLVRSDLSQDSKAFANSFRRWGPSDIKRKNFRSNFLGSTSAKRLIEGSASFTNEEIYCRKVRFDFSAGEKRTFFF